MARVAGIHKGFLTNLVRKGRVPCEIRDGARWFKVDDVLRVALTAQLPFKPLRAKEASYLADARWAWDALSLGPWNCRTAESARAWALYLLAKTDPVIKRKLARLHLDEACRELERTPRPVSDEDSPASETEPEILESDVDEVDEEDEPLTVAEIAMRDLDLSKVSRVLTQLEPPPEAEPAGTPDEAEGAEY